MNPTLICFGEVLWDVLPTSKQPGGAPMNVAADLRNFGHDARLISRVGSDELGRELLDFLDQKGIPTQLVQTGQSHLTGVAKANVSDSSEVTYKIVMPVAWDYIRLAPGLVDVVRQSDYFIYGSLAARSHQTHVTLQTLLAAANKKVFDVNIRAPHYSKELVESLLHQADMAKLNEHELIEITDWYQSETDLRPAMQQVYDRYQLETLCVTLGADGAALLDETGFYTQPGFPVQVADTIGSGDAFLAAFLHKTIQHETPQNKLAFACATGAYVATQPGATPSFTEATLVSFLEQAAVPRQ